MVNADQFKAHRKFAEISLKFQADDVRTQIPNEETRQLEKDRTPLQRRRMGPFQARKIVEISPKSPRNFAEISTS